MTTADILALPAGPELDGLIDEVVFGIDRTANTPLARFMAISSGMKRGCGESLALEIDGKEIIIPTSDCTHIDHTTKDFSKSETWIWLSRHGKPWQAALEKHVAAWRAPPTQKYSTDWSAAGPLLERLAASGECDMIFDVGGEKDGGGFRLCDMGIDGMLECVVHGETAPLAIARAAAILLGKDKP